MAEGPELCFQQKTKPSVIDMGGFWTQEDQKCLLKGPTLRIYSYSIYYFVLFLF